MATRRIFNHHLSISKPWNSRAVGEEKREEIIHKVGKVPYFFHLRPTLFFFFFEGGKSDLEGIKIPQGVLNLFSLRGQVPHVALKSLSKMKVNA